MNKKKVSILLFTLFLFLALTVNPVHAVQSLAPYPDTLIRLTAYGTYMMWMETIYFDTLVVTDTQANFTNIYTTGSSVLSVLSVVVENANITATSIPTGGIATFTLDGTLGGTGTALIGVFGTIPYKVTVDGTEHPVGDMWTWDGGTGKLNFTVPFTLASSADIIIDWNIPGGPGGPGGPDPSPSPSPTPSPSPSPSPSAPPTYPPLTPPPTLDFRLIGALAIGGLILLVMTSKKGKSRLHASSEAWNRSRMKAQTKRVKFPQSKTKKVRPWKREKEWE